MSITDCPSLFLPLATAQFISQQWAKHSSNWSCTGVVAGAHHAYENMVCLQLQYPLAAANVILALQSISSGQIHSWW